MNFKKVYEEFETAQASYDLEKMSDIIAQVNKHCKDLAEAGRANEIPPEAQKVAAHVNVMIYFVMKLLSDGNGDKAKIYLASLAQDREQFERYFYFYYLFGRALYLTGDYLRGAKCFKQYEKLREKFFSDEDELSLFYRANCLALTKNFSEAAELYKKVLRIKADFPEAKNNLELALKGATKNFSREIKSLWNFCDWRDMPIFINARDRLGVMKKLIYWLLSAGYRNLIILDNASTYPPLLEYYSALEGVKIIRLGKNLGYKALWLSGVLEQMKISTPYVYTDPDILPIERCPKNFVEQLMKVLASNHELRKVGLGLEWKGITFFDRERARQLESNLYSGTKIGENLYYAQVDTTFALYSNVRHYSLRFSVRTTGDLMAYHLPWYFDYGDLPDDEKYYLTHADKNSVTTIKKILEA